MTIFFYKGFTRNSEIGKTPVGFLETGGVKNTKFGSNVSNKMLLNSTKCQGYSFYRFLVIRGKPTTGNFTSPHPPRLVLNGI